MEVNLNLEWKNLNLHVKKSEFKFWQCKKHTEDKTILNNVSGSLQSGQLVAILGQSGAGKTTLLAGISYRFRGPLEGQLLLNGASIDRKTMTKISCFVPQFDITMDTLTPNEHLYFMAELKLDRRWSRARKSDRVNCLLHELSLHEVANNRISNLSGGERKKLNLATDLLTNPPIIFCDEPTSGLDSFNAKKVIEALKYLSSTNTDVLSPSPFEDQSFDGSNEVEMSLISQTPAKMPAKAIICSIHQPTSDIFQCFSEIILMHAGRCIFQGNTQDAFDFFSRFGYHCPKSFNPADFFINVMSQTDNRLQVTDDNMNKSVASDRNSSHRPQHEIAIKQCKNHNSLWLKQVWVLLQRFNINAQRNARKLLIALALYLVPFSIYGLLFTDLSGTTQEGIQNVQGLLFTLSCEIMFSTMYRILSFYLTNTALLRRETNEQVYCFSAYYVAAWLSDVPFLSIRPLVGLLLTYIMGSFDKGIVFFFELWITLTFMAFTANAYGQMLVGVFRWLILEVPTVFNLIFMTLSGAYANLADYPTMKYISLFYYAYEAMSIFFWHDVSEIECSERFDGICLKNGTEVLTNIAFNTNLEDVFWDFVGLLVLGTVMNTAAFIGIRRFIHSAGYY